MQQGLVARVAGKLYYLSSTLWSKKVTLFMLFLFVNIWNIQIAQEMRDIKYPEREK